MEREQVFEKPSVIICGYGIVGKNLKTIFKWADIYDVKPNFDEIKEGKFFNKFPSENKYDFAFVSVPTPMKDDSDYPEADLTYVEDVLQKTEADIYIIKSTVPPNTTDYLVKKYNKKIIFSPEYQGNTQHANRDYNFVVLGGNSNLTRKVAELYQYACTADLEVYQVDSVTAELCKYMENSFLACKVVFCNEFYRIAKMYGVDYTKLRECFVADPRVNPSHTFVYPKYPFYDSKCFNKDLPALYKATLNMGYNAKLIKSIIDTNKVFMAGGSLDD